MNIARRLTICVFAALATVALSGCNSSPGNPGGMLGGGANGTIVITVAAGVNPDYSWADGDGFSLSVVRTANPTVVVWGVVTPGVDGVVSAVTHGTVPAGAVQTALAADLEGTLTAGVEYRVTVSRTDESFGFTDFTP